MESKCFLCVEAAAPGVSCPGAGCPVVACSQQHLALHLQPASSSPPPPPCCCPSPPFSPYSLLLPFASTQSSLQNSTQAPVLGVIFLLTTITITTITIVITKVTNIIMSCQPDLPLPDVSCREGIGSP